MSDRVDWDRLQALIRAHYRQPEGLIPLHAPCFDQLEKARVSATIDSTFVSSVGPDVTEFERQVAEYTGVEHAVAVVNGTMGLYLALKVVGIEPGDLVVTQSLTFVATPNAITMHQSEPVFVDVERDTLGMCPQSLEQFLTTQTHLEDGCCVHTESGRRVRACVPMHTLGFPVRVDALKTLCERHHLALVEDAAESLGSFYQGQHTGTLGDVGVISFNGNKILTTGGGGMLLTHDADLAARARHLSTTAKVPHAWRFDHDEHAYNLRMPNLNAALGVAQMQKLPMFLEVKRAWAHDLQAENVLPMLTAPQDTNPNFWLNALLCENADERDAFLAWSQSENLQTRPLWTPMHHLPMYQHCEHTELPRTEWLADRVVTVPSGVPCEVLSE
ncbi:LegC family aminotransferase [Thiomicrospira sp. WB1]|uniref:LegC family aminotransferase n=1 Tax=Thiomicrospira sp. WB1 TaxID=1685380 RepID=UPI000749C818|nr:LegC family aminotransferase [Thiomicrospira sp. WB1]KUJ71614.1 aminotransferase DegT [Thiomicrospira sp. WB1]